MYKVPLSEIKDKLIQSGKITPRELDERIKKKINDLSGLISEEGAACILANEFGVNIYSAQGKLKIKEVYAGMRDISTVGKVMRKFEPREFTKGETKGKVCSVILGDETGTIRVVFWNEQVDLLTKVNLDDILLVKDAYVRENNNDREIHLGNRGEIVINPPGETIGIVAVLPKQALNLERKKIEALKDGEDGIELMGTVIQVFDPRFFNTCPECGKKVTESEGAFTCDEHKIVTPTQSYVLNAILDDGTGTIRAVFWRNQTNHLLGKEDAEVIGYKNDLSKFEDVKTDLLGEQFKLVGRVKRNEMFDRLELNVQLVEKASPQEEIVKLKDKSS